MTFKKTVLRLKHVHLNVSVLPCAMPKKKTSPQPHYAVSKPPSTPMPLLLGIVRDKLGLSTPELAELHGCSYSTIARLISGEAIGKPMSHQAQITQLLCRVIEATQAVVGREPSLIHQWFRTAMLVIPGLPEATPFNTMKSLEGLVRLCLHMEVMSNALKAPQ